MVDRRQKHRFDQLGLRSGAAHDNERLAGEDRRTFGDGPDVARKPEITEIVDEFVGEDLLRTHIFDIFGGKVQILQIFNGLLETGRDRKTAAVRYFAVKKIEISDFILQTVVQKAVGHGEFVEIGQHRKIDAVEHFVHVGFSCLYCEIS